MCEDRGLETKTFIAEKGDVLIWHGDLMRGGVPIQDQTRTRLSLIAHLMPLGVMPTFFDFSQAGVIPYSGGGYSIDVPLERHALAAGGDERLSEDRDAIRPNRSVEELGATCPLRSRVPRTSPHGHVRTLRTSRD